MPVADWTLFFNLIISAVIGSLVGGFLGYIFNRKRDNDEWERRLLALEKQKKDLIETNVQKGWNELKLNAYVRIIEALKDIVESYQMEFEHEIGERQLSREERDRSSEQWKHGHREVQKASIVGAFLISEEAKDALEGYLREDSMQLAFSGKMGFGEALDNQTYSSKRCLELITKAAKEDLQVG